MRKNILMIMLGLMFVPTLVLAQRGGPVVFTVDQDTVWGAEFERVYNKNNRTPDVRPSMAELEEYQNLYVRFKLKVKEAYRLGMDTNQAYVKELAGYRRQLAQPYLTDKTVTDKLIQEAYDRMKLEVNASNLMIHLSPLATPEDTLKAFNRISSWRDLIVSGTHTFDKLTRDSSTDEHGRNHGGNLGYFSAFNMIYPFENQAYNTEVGGISEVFRTQFGYHVLMVNDKREARGDLKVAHILIRINNEKDYETNKPRIDAIYEKLKAGEDWEQLVKDFSEDFNTRERNGELNWVKSIGGNVPEEFREASYTLKEGTYSKPVKTELGWHIIKHIESKPIPDYTSAKESIKLKISRDSRSSLNRQAVVNRIKVENDFVVDEKNWVTYIDAIDSSFVKGVNWEAPAACSGNMVLFTIGSKDFDAAGFTEFVHQNPASAASTGPETHAEKLFTRYSDGRNLEYEEAILEEKYDDFHYLMQEYRDGILLFELTNKMVWSKATEDTTGLEKYFEDNVDNYQWKERAVTRTYVCNNSKTAKKLASKIRKGARDETMLIELNKKNALSLKVISKVYEKGTDSLVDALDWKGGLQKLPQSNNQLVYVRFDSTMMPGPKRLNEAMGPVTSDYQTYLEDKWIEDLKSRYKVVHNPGALDQLFTRKD